MTTRNAVAVPALLPVGKQINRQLPGQAKRLQYWEMLFLEWLENHPKPRPSNALALAKATELSKRTVSLAEIDQLRYRRRAGKEYIKKLREAMEGAAKELMAADLTFMVNAHHLGTEMALADPAGYKYLPNFTRPYLDRAWQLKTDVVNATQVNITLSMKQSAMIDDQPLIEVTAEPIPDESSNT